MSLFENKSVKAVKQALAAAGSEARVVKLAKSARTAEEAAVALNTPLGSIVKSLVFTVGGTPVLALISGDKTCAEDTLPRALNMEGEVAKAGPAAVQSATGFSIGGVSPVGLPSPLPTVIDVSLKRFATVYAAAGHPHYVFATSVAELRKLTDGIVSYNITEGEKHHPVKAGTTAD